MSLPALTNAWIFNVSSASLQSIKFHPTLIRFLVCGGDDCGLKIADPDRRGNILRSPYDEGEDKRKEMEEKKREEESINYNSNNNNNNTTTINNLLMSKPSVNTVCSFHSFYQGTPSQGDFVVKGKINKECDNLKKCYEKITFTILQKMDVKEEIKEELVDEYYEGVKSLYNNSTPVFKDKYDLIVVGFESGEIDLLNSPLSPMIEPHSNSIEAKIKEKIYQGGGISFLSSNKKKKEERKEDIDKYIEWMKERKKDNDNVVITPTSTLCKNAIEKYSRSPVVGYVVERHTKVHEEKVVVIRVTSDNRFVLTIDDDGVLVLWEVKERTEKEKEDDIMLMKQNKNKEKKEKGTMGGDDDDNNNIKKHKKKKTSTNNETFFIKQK